MARCSGKERCRGFFDRAAEAIERSCESELQCLLQYQYSSSQIHGYFRVRWARALFRGLKSISTILLLFGANMAGGDSFLPIKFLHSNFRSGIWLAATDIVQFDSFSGMQSIFPYCLLLHY